MADLNTQHACSEMRKLGIVPKMAVILADNLEDISRSVRVMSENYTAVITMGGIGKRCSPVGAVFSPTVCDPIHHGLCMDAMI